MKIRSTMLSIYLSIAVSCFSQQDYPQIKVIDNDTVVLITPQQVDSINKTFLQLDMYKELNESMIEQDSLAKQVILTCKESLNKAEEEIVKEREINNEKDTQIKNLNIITKKQQKKIELLKKSRNLMTITAAIVGGVLTLLIVN